MFKAYPPMTTTSSLSGLLSCAVCILWRLLLRVAEAEAEAAKKATNAAAASAAADSHLVLIVVKCCYPRLVCGLLPLPPSNPLSRTSISPLFLLFRK